jgi:cbb3-type cytochrome oxidase subunit 3
MSTEKSVPQESIFRSEGLVLIILTATAYAAFLVREMGYADFYSIPHDLIATSHIGLLSAAQAIAWGAVAYIGKVNLVWIFTPRGERFIFRMIRYAIGASLVVGFALYPYLVTDTGWWWLGLTVGVFVVSWFVWPLVTQRKVQGYENKVKEQALIEAGGNDIYGTLLGRFDRTTTITFLFAIAMMVFAYGDGRRSAIEQEEYNLVEGEQNVALLRVYGEVIVSVAFDPKTRQLSGLIRVAKLPDGKGVEIRRKVVGQLKKVNFKK